ncbi:major capsid protein [Neorhizobium sp. T786]|uniref:major capsid protein n=1 Tax=Pseudorhizobium xiangyangii TaxID=2883104 RepID=UPI001CFFA6D0|nr:major capsid protein [Neorhizobium xiangyangii]MCB5201715.1 major capsid protein [Neorhizobium xiangyangii]
MHMDIFNDDAFSATSMTTAIETYEYQPGLISSMNLFDNVPIATTTVSVEKRGNGFELIPTTLRGEPLAEGRRDDRNIRMFPTRRIAKGHTLQASEIQNVRAFGTESELETAIGYVARYQQRLMREVEATWEFMRLGAVFGKVMDASGSVVVDWFNEWTITRPAAIDFALDTAGTNVEQKCRDVLRRVQDVVDERWLPNSSVVGLAGDSFFDKLTGHAKVTDTYLNQSQANTLNRAFGVATQSGFRAGSYATFEYGGILFINYKGSKTFKKTDAEGDNSGKEAFGVRSTRCKFFPINAPGVFQEAFAPGESFEWANTIGRPVYSLILRDKDRDFWMRPEVYSYPLFICTVPEALFEAKESASA